MNSKRKIRVEIAAAAVGLLALLLAGLLAAVHLTQRSGDASDLSAVRGGGEVLNQAVSDNSVPKSSSTNGQQKDAWGAYADKKTEAILKAYARRGDERTPALESAVRRGVEESLKPLIAEGVDPSSLPDPSLRHYRIRPAPIKRERYTGPQTVEAILAEFDEDFLKIYQGRDKDSTARAALLAKLLERGATIKDSRDYTRYMAGVWGTLNYYQKHEGTLRGVQRRQRFDLAESAPWSEVEAATLDEEIRRWSAEKAEEDAYFERGIKTVRVHIDQDNFSVSLSGQVSVLSEEQQYVLAHYGVAPEGLNVMYVDKRGVPINAEKAPRLSFERRVDAMSDTEWEAAVYELINWNPAESERWGPVEWMSFSDYMTAVLGSMKPPETDSSEISPSETLSSLDAPLELPSAVVAPSEHPAGVEPPSPRDSWRPFEEEADRSAEFLELLDAYLDSSDAISSEARDLLKRQADAYRRRLKKRAPTLPVEQR